MKKKYLPASFRNYRAVKQSGLSMSYFWLWLREKWKHDLCVLVWLTYSWPLVLAVVLVAIIEVIGEALVSFARFLDFGRRGYKAPKVFHMDWIPEGHKEAVREYRQALKAIK